jgi:hypothetical protein
MQNPEKKYRYPGTNYFTKRDKDIFRGRAQDTEKLYNQIMLKETVVLHGKSGLGKSSLVEAGIIPMLAEKGSNYVAVTIRFNESETELLNESVSHAPEALVTKIINRIRAEEILKENIDIPFVKKVENNLWYFFKQIEKEGKELLLILDQFEELEEYTIDQISFFKKKLAEIFQLGIPREINEAINAVTDKIDYEALQDEEKEHYVEKINFLEAPLKTKVVFVIREDKLGTMCQLSDYFPNILKRNYQLKPLTESGARDAINQPAGLVGENYLTPTFSFSSEATNLLIKQLNTDNGYFDPLQIQIVCRDIERKVRALEKPDHVVNGNELSNIEDVIHEFYEQCWQTVKDSVKFGDETLPIEIGTENLAFNDLKLNFIKKLGKNRRRRQVPKDELYKYTKGEEVVKVLIKEGLIVRKLIDKIPHYRISHDRILLPLIADLEKVDQERAFRDQQKTERDEWERKEKEKENELREEGAKKIRQLKWMIATFSVLGVALIICLNLWIDAAKSEKKAKEQEFITISDIIYKDDPTLSYLVAKKWGEANKGDLTDKFISHMAVLDTMKNYYLSRMFPISGDVISATFIDNKIQIIDSQWKTVWKVKGNSPHKKEDLDYFNLKEHETNTGTYLSILTTDSLEIRDSLDQKITSFPKPKDLENIAITLDCKYILLDEKIYIFNSGELLGDISSNEIATGRLMSAVFFDDKKHIALGYRSGNILIFNIDENNLVEPIRLVQYFNPPEKMANSEITAMVFDQDNEYLIAGNGLNTIEIWKLSSFNDNIDLVSIEEVANVTEPFRVLKGHFGAITALSVSHDNKYVLSGGADHLAILWDLETGALMSTLRESSSKSELSYTAFSSNDESIYTAFKDGKFCIWKKGKAHELYEKGELKQYSPFDYMSLGIQDRPLSNEGSREVVPLYSFLLNYILSIPEINEYPENKNYLKILKEAMTEIDELHIELIASKGYKDIIPIGFREALDEYYFQLKIRIPDLLSKFNLDMIEAFELIDCARYFEASNNEISMYMADVDTTRSVYTPSHKNNVLIRKLWIRQIEFYEETESYSKGVILTKEAQLIWPNDSYFIEKQRNLLYEIDRVLAIKRFEKW